MFPYQLIRVIYCFFIPLFTGHTQYVPFSVFSFHISLSIFSVSSLSTHTFPYLSILLFFCVSLLLLRVEGFFKIGEENCEREEFKGGAAICVGRRTGRRGRNCGGGGGSRGRRGWWCWRSRRGRVRWGGGEEVDDDGKEDEGVRRVNGGGGGGAVVGEVERGVWTVMITLNIFPLNDRTTRN